MRAKVLKSKYGKLEVLDVVSDNNRRFALVRCACGTKKRVLVQHLFSGKTTSCGSGTCRRGTKAAKLARTYKPRGSSIPLGALFEVWAATELAEVKISVAEAAKSHAPSVPIQTLYSALRAVRRCGGIDAYARSVNRGEK